MTKTPKGVCAHCNRVYSYKNSFKHIEKCTNNGPSYNGHLIKIQWPQKSPLQWMYLSVPFFSSLEKLDQLLKDTWGEGCHHASRFKTRGAYFESDSKNIMPVKVGEFYRADMKFPSGSILGLVKKTLGYELDYENNSKELLIVVIKSHKSQSELPTILMQSVMPPPNC